MARGAAQLVELTGKDFESIVGLHRHDGGWQVQVELTEVRRVPSTTDVLGCYEVELDGVGHLTGYRRVGRYLRGEAGGEQ